MQDHKLAVAFRLYPGLQKNESIIPNDKYKLIKACLTTFKESLQDINTKILFILDSCPKKYENYIVKLFNGYDIIIKKGNNIGNHGTFNMQLEWLLEQSFSEYVYFAEDDYIYNGKNFKSFIENYKLEGNIEFATPYDHPDYYTLVSHEQKNTLLKTTSCGHKWLKRGSTTMTFLTTKKTLKETQSVFNLYGKIGDIGIWYILTRRIKYLKTALHIMYKKEYRWLLHFMSKSIIYYLYNNIRFYNMPHSKYMLCSYHPSAATHAEAKYLAGDTDWNRIIDNTHT
jgi:hypothetical protein